MSEYDRMTVTLDGTKVNQSFTWWLEPKDKIGEAMVAVAEKYSAGMADRREQCRRYVQLDKGQILTHNMIEAGLPRSSAEDVALSWNVIQAGRNTAMSVVLRNRVRVMLDTNGADYMLQEAAKDGELFIQGVFNNNKLYEEIDPLVFNDAATPGLGIYLTEPDVFGNTTIKRIIPDALVFNEVEFIRGKARQIFYVEWMSPWDAVSQYATTYEKVKGEIVATVDKRKEAAILAVKTFQQQIPGLNNEHIPLIPIWHGWYLPSFRGAKDGRRVTAVAGVDGRKGATLRCDTWRWTRFPFTFYQIEKAPVGLWGIGIAERLAAFQYQLNDINYEIAEARRLSCHGKWMVDTGSNVNKAQLNNEHEGIIDYTTIEPKHVVIDGIPRGLLEERQETYQQALREIGLSEWTVGGTQPDNIESGEGLRQLREQEQGRALPAGQQFEHTRCDIAECVIMAGLDGFDKNKQLSVSVQDPNGDGMTKIEFETVAELFQDPDAYQIRKYPTSILPSSPTGKFEKLREWKADGTIDHATFVALSDMPDLHTESSLLLAGIKAVRKAITNIVRKGATGYEPPDPAMPLDFAIKLGHMTYLKGLTNGMPETKLALLLNFIDDARALQEPSQQVKGGEGAAMPGAAGAAGGAPGMGPVVDPTAPQVPTLGAMPAPGSLPIADPALSPPPLDPALNGAAPAAPPGMDPAAMGAMPPSAVPGL